MFKVKVNLFDFFFTFVILNLAFISKRYILKQQEQQQYIYNVT